jgi:hypothetical protein
MELGPEMRSWLAETARSFHGARRRRFLAQTVQALGLSQRRAALALGWARDTVRKGLHELHSGITCLDNFSARGRKPSEVRLPGLLTDIADLVQDHLQTDPTFRTTRLYCRLSAAEVRRQLIDRKGYPPGRLPSVQTIATKLNDLGFRLRPVTKSKPQKAEGDRCDLRAPESSPPGRRRLRRYAPAVAGFQGPRAHRPVLARRQEPARDRRGRS